MNFLKQTFFSIGLFLVFLIPTQSAEAATRDQLLAQIQSLLEQISHLQALVNEMNKEGVEPIPIPANLYQTAYYDGPLESVYEVSIGKLRKYNGQEPRRVDEEYFEFITELYGDDIIEKYIGEFRVFSNSQLDLGAFVEKKLGGKWIIGINRYDLDLDYKSDREYFADLLIHELAHILIYYESDSLENFTNKFWTYKDSVHSKKLESLSGDEQFYEMYDYYKGNKSRFFSDYATYNVDEDYSESFVAYVLNKASRYDGEKYNKQVFFNDYDSLRQIRLEIRSNLRDLDLF